MRQLFLFAFFAVALVLTGCEKEINLKLDEGVVQLSVDAFITDKSGAQVIKLRTTQGYFINKPNPPALGAAVKITDGTGKIYNFIDSASTGNYAWIPQSGDTLVKAGEFYTLSISYNGEEYSAISIANPVPAIDSINYKFGKSSDPSVGEAYRASFYATDITGRPDFYWIKSFQNGKQVSPDFLNLSQDGSYGPGTDGLPFILPIRESINPEPEGLAVGDSMVVEVHSLSAEAYFFFQQVQQQKGNAGLFAPPPSNVSTNIKNVKNSENTATGYFNVGMISTAGIRIKS